MTLSASSNLEMYRGDNQVWSITAEEDGSAIDLTDATVKFAVYTSPGPAGSTTDDSGALITKTSDTAGEIDLTDPTNGIFELTVVKSDTYSIEMQGAVNYYAYGIEYTPSGYTEPRNLGTGTFVLYPDIVRA